MGAVAVSAHKHGSNVLGILPKAMASPEIKGHVPEERWKVEVVPSMHVRKATMARACDAFIAMPGGFGTMEELFETLTWIQLGIHAKPVVLFNVNGYVSLSLSLSVSLSLALDPVSDARGGNRC
eukprot:TRINITY_DN3735_c0_g1_i2.p2 TRINITY_DN3735_c0_g1~~TRINITY_DN3735_c0_g1_i2.p2  ORF type:complete len:124 (-),score=23.09 TRINITY_DN3735_c0_g1_i2:858-1229(-)